MGDDLLHGSDEDEVRCSMCGEEFLHPMAVYVQPNRYDPARRELDFTVRWTCESCGLSYSDHFRFHKGTTFRQIRDIGETRERDAWD